MTELRVVRGEPTAEELAALVVALAGRAAPPPVPVPDAPGWGRTPALAPAPGAWRASAWLPGVRPAPAGE